MQDKTILSLDLGGKTGWAVRIKNGSIFHGMNKNGGGRFEGGGMRFLRFNSFLNSLHNEYSLDAVFYEEVRRHIGTDASHAYGGYLATLTTWCEHKKIPYQGVPVGTIKKHATGKGNANKDAMIKAMQEKGHEITDDNEADALALLYYTQEV